MWFWEHIDSETYEKLEAYKKETGQAWIGYRVSWILILASIPIMFILQPVLGDAVGLVAIFVFLPSAILHDMFEKTLCKILFNFELPFFPVTIFRPSLFRKYPGSPQDAVEKILAMKKNTKN